MELCLCFPICHDDVVVSYGRLGYVAGKMPSSSSVCDNTGNTYGVYMLVNMSVWGLCDVTPCNLVAV